MLTPVIYQNPIAHLQQEAPMEPVLYFCKKALRMRVHEFQTGFSGQLTYAVKCNPHPNVLRAMLDMGLKEFDVASPREIECLRDLSKTVRLNYNNPIRSRAEIKFALERDVHSFSVDCVEEIHKLADLAPRDCELSVRLKLDLEGAAYHFGEKFGATPREVVEMLKIVHDLGFKTSATFHVGTQCENPENYAIYIRETAQAAKQAGVRLHRLNVGGGFPSARSGGKPDFARYFAQIEAGIRDFQTAPQILCEPGRALIGDACQYVVQIKSLREGRWAFLNDGVYGGLSEAHLLGSTHYSIYDPDGNKRQGQVRSYKLYGPTCDSIDSFREDFDFPQSTKEGDFMLFDGAGAYTIGLNTNFNGYGHVDFIEVDRLSF